MKTLNEPSDGLADTLVDDFMGHPDPGITVDSGLDWARRNPLLRAHQVVDLDPSQRSRTTRGRRCASSRATGSAPASSRRCS